MEVWTIEDQFFAHHEASDEEATRYGILKFLYMWNGASKKEIVENFRNQYFDSVCTGVSDE